MSAEKPEAGTAPTPTPDPEARPGSREKSAVEAQAGVTDEEPEETDSIENPPPLPFSKARCIAIVVTTTGASFMNVSCLRPSSLPLIPRLPNNSNRPLPHRAR